MLAICQDISCLSIRVKEINPIGSNLGCLLLKRTCQDCGVTTRVHHIEGSRFQYFSINTAIVFLFSFFFPYLQ